MFQMAKRASLLRQIHRDIEASKMEPKRTAFGRSLPSYMQRVPNKEDIAKKWLQCQNVPMKLKTMQTVWEGITHLRFANSCFVSSMWKITGYLCYIGLFSSEFYE